MAKKKSLGLVWLRAYLDQDSPTFLNATASAKKVGYGGRSGHSFRQLGYKNRVKFAAKISEWLDQEGFSEASLKIRLLSLLEAKETVFQKLKGAIMQSELPPGHRVVATSGTVVKTKDGHVYGDGDTLIEIDVQALETQRRSLDMALKIKGIFAAEKVEHCGSVAAKIELTDADRVLFRKVIDASINKLMELEHAKPA